MTHVILRFLWMIFVGWWTATIWFLIGYFLIALIVTRQQGFWMFQRMGVVYSLQEPLIREIYFSKNIITYIWFYSMGWFLGFFWIPFTCLYSLFLITFSRSENAIANIDLSVISYQ